MSESPLETLPGDSPQLADAIDNQPTTPTYGNRPRGGSFTSLFSKQLPLEQETTGFILVSSLDLFMTYFLLRMDRGFFESNPIANYFIHHWDVVGMVGFKFTVVAFVCILAQVIALKNLGRARQVLQIGIVIVFSVVVYSATLLVRFGGLF